MIVTEETKAAAQGVLDYIIANPEKHDQRHFVADSSSFQFDDNVCGTTMCIAGTAVFVIEGVSALRECTFGSLDFEHEGARILGLDEAEATALFYTMDNEVAVDMTNAIAQGDADKFYALHNSYTSSLDEDE
jgi:hypothetical protein